MDCYYHPHNPLLNFCQNPSCALPLCPKCISIHLEQSNQQHQIVPIQQTQQQTAHQIQILLNNLTQQHKALTEEYSPENILRDYEGLLEKYRQQAISQINQHYDYLQRQLLAEIGTRHSQHLQRLTLPLEQLIHSLQTTQKNVKDHNKYIQTLILTVSQNTLKNAQDMLNNIKEKKRIFKGELPRLQDGQGGRLKMTSQKHQVTSERIPQRVPQRIPPTFSNLPSYHPPANQLQGLNRIAELQAHLHSLKFS